jgi:hypothetical protein
MVAGMAAAEVAVGDIDAAEILQVMKKSNLKFEIGNKVETN